MSFLSRKTLVAAASMLFLAGASSRPVLRVCADPNNLPFSNRAGEGFENAVARLIASDLGARLAYTWWPERRGFTRLTLLRGNCDVILGVPDGVGTLALTRPWYRSSYVFVTRQDRGLRVRSFDDPRLRRLRIGLHALGADYASTPPASELARRGIVGNLRGYSIYGDYSRPDPPADLLRAVERGDIDVAIAWGPLAGYFARHVADAPLALDLISGSGAAEPMSFSIAAAVRPADSALRAMLDAEFARRRPEIARLLEDYGIPLIAGSPAGRAP